VILKGDLINRVTDEELNINPKLKIGDIVTSYDVRTFDIGVITQLPKDDDRYTIFYSEENDYMDHTHLPEDWLYKVNHIDDDILRRKLEETLKACLSEKDYQLLKREDKLNRIINNE